MGYAVINKYNDKVLKLASELSHKRVVEGGCQKIWEDEDGDQTIYTQEAQTLFDEYNNSYEDMIRNIMR